jgi:tRNA pseudouridine55 synthase
MFGLLNLDKPRGVTSRDVVNRVQPLVRPAKVGHAGTLDPLATGVLVVCIGPATRLVEYVQRMPKRYRGTFLLGRTSPTEDTEAEVKLLDGAPQPCAADVQRAAAALVGEIEQRPPAFSAVKVAGRRAYELARRGSDVVLAPRPVTVYRLEVARYEYPELVLDVECSGGTYVRSLGRDLAESLSTGAVMSALVRMAIGGFSLERAHAPDDLTAGTLREWLMPPASALGEMPQVTLGQAQLDRLACGQPIALDIACEGEIAAFDSHDRLRAILDRQDKNLWRPAINFPARNP